MEICERGLEEAGDPERRGKACEKIQELEGSRVTGPNLNHDLFDGTISINSAITVNSSLSDSGIIIGL